MDTATDAAASVPTPHLPRSLSPSTWAGLWVLAALVFLTGARISFRK